MPFRHEGWNRGARGRLLPVLSWVVGLSWVFSVGACGDDSAGTGGGTGGEKPQPEIVIDLVVDADRDGVADPASQADQDGEEIWSPTAGAMFLPNLDDDDQDGFRDCDDTVANGGADDLDRARFLIAACPECSKKYVGTFSIDAASAPNVRVFALALDGTAWRLVAGETAACNDQDKTCAPVTSFTLTSDELRAGLTLAIEARDVVRSTSAGWQGEVELSYGITNADGEPLTSEANPEGLDRARLRVAPWQLFGNLSPFDRVWSSSDSPVFVTGVLAGAEQAGVTYKRYSNYGDQWTQDFFQTGFFAVTRRDESGNVVTHGMSVANARPWGQSSSMNNLPIRWLERNYLGPDKATLVVYEDAQSGDTFDSHGNHDLIPAYSTGQESFPLGRILIGSGVLPETKAFYTAQGLQAPYHVANTAWLWVGHVDEYLSFVPANTARGWKLLVGSPRLAREMMLEQQVAGNGATPMHVGKRWYDFNSNGTFPADTTIDEVLADITLMEASQEAQLNIDEEVDKLRVELALGVDEVIEIPFIFNQVQYGPDKFNIAYQPGTVNALVMGDTIVMAKPFGPQINGEDMFEADLRQRIGGSALSVGSDGQGMNVFFADDWDVYHRLDGEVHCGTNPEASAPFASVSWWETDR